MFHNRVKEALNDQAVKAQQQKILKYNLLFNLAMKLKSKQFRIDNSIPLTAHVLVLNKILFHNPDSVTFWNDRRKIFSTISKQSLPSLFVSELDFALSIPQTKSYALFRHFEWLLEQSPLQTISCFSKVNIHCIKLLQQDCRNFHAFDLFQYVNIKSFQLFPSEPVIYGHLHHLSHMISDNLTNNSAWHHRFTAISQLNNASQVYQDELEALVHALSTSKNNSSLWFHLLRLLRVGSSLSQSHIQTLLSVAPDANRWLSLFQQLLKFENTWKIQPQVHNVLEPIRKALNLM